MNAELQDVTDSAWPQIPVRAPDSHKGRFGRALLVGGSRGMSGAISLSGMACLRSGAGLVTLAVPAEIQAIVAGFSPAYMTLAWHGDGLPENSSVSKLLQHVDSSTALAVGPGIGRSDFAASLACELHDRAACPAVIDADGLNAIAARGEIRSTQGGWRIFTPHPGEFARLITDSQLAECARGNDEQRTEAAVALARRDPGGRTIAVLKGHRTVVTDGTKFSINSTGNPGLATGGTGDVLTGVITGLLSQGLSPWDAARLGVFLHGLAGDVAAAELGQVALVASDLIDYLPQVLVRHCQ